MKRLLLVEDDADMRALITLTLDVEPRVAIAGEASSADEALLAVERQRPDLIILDHYLDGDVTGLDLAPALKELAPASKILVFTSHDLAVETGRRTSVDGYLRKSQRSRLLGCVRELLGLADAA